jgi:AGZA family xanthine/uracil permease-like MFS transporter
MGLAKTVGALAGDWLRRVIPQAALLGSIAGVALLLIAFLPTLKIIADPMVGFLSLGVVLLTLIARVPAPFRLPGAFAAVLLGTAASLAMGWLNGARSDHSPAFPEAVRLAVPFPSLEFLGGLGMAWAFFPIALPFAVATMVGGIDVTESAAASGDAYRTRDILLTEGAATLLAALCGGVVQNTPYIGHPAYKAMGARAGYTLATALFIGLGGMLGFLSYLVKVLPEAAVAPILIFIGLEIVAQAFQATPARHARAVAIAFLPCVANLVAIEMKDLMATVHAAGARPPGGAALTYATATLLGNGFILTAVLWGAATAFLIDRRLGAAALTFFVRGTAALFGVIHSPLESGGLVLPWTLQPAPSSP